MLTFKRGTHNDLNNIDITQDMLYFTTDDNSIYYDTADNRYKIFGLSNNDITTSLDNTSINQYFNNTADFFLSINDIATNGNTSNKKAIGRGYYNDIIGNNYYNNFTNSITQNINFIQNEGRSTLHLLWNNQNPSSTWSEDISTSHTSVDESITINLTTAYLGYILLFKSYLSDNCIYPITTFALPSSIYDGELFRSLDNEYKIGSSSSNVTKIKTTFTLSLSGNNYKTCTINKKGNLVSGNSGVDFHNYLVPIALYGWEL